MSPLNSFGSRAKLGEHFIYRLDALTRSGVTPRLDRLPYSIGILLESLLRHEDGHLVTMDDVERLATWNPSQPSERELPLMPARVVMQDFTGGACIADLAAMRDAVYRLGRDPQMIIPRIPVDLVIDHTVIVDYFGTSEAAQKNTRLGYARNRERYEFFKWGSRA
ncbi:MAG TPA: aconitase family protein, partial [Anaerolineae bacterium]